MDINKDLDYYKQLLERVNNNYEENVMGELNYEYTVQGEVSPIVGNEEVDGAQAVNGYNNDIEEENSFISNIEELASFQTDFISNSITNLNQTNSDIDTFMKNIVGVPAGNEVTTMINATDFVPNPEHMELLGEGSENFESTVQAMNIEHLENLLSIQILQNQQNFLTELDIEASFSGLGADEQELFVEILNSFDDLVTNYQSAAQNDGLNVDITVADFEDGMIGGAFSDTNLAALKLNKAKDMLTKLSEGMSADDLSVYEKTLDYEIEFNEQLNAAVDEFGIGSEQANLFSAKAEASRRTKEYVESVHTMKTSNDLIDQEIVQEWNATGFDPLGEEIITAMETDILNATTVQQVQALYKGDDSKYNLAQMEVTSKREQALALTNVNRDGNIDITEIARLLTEANANGGEVDGLGIDIIKAALTTNGVSDTTMNTVDGLINDIGGPDGVISFDEALYAYNNLEANDNWPAFKQTLDILAVTQVSPEDNPELFMTIGEGDDAESLFIGSYESENEAVLSQLLSSHGRYIHTIEDKFEALDDFHDNAGDTQQQNSDWREYRYSHFAAHQAKGDIDQDSSLAWYHKTGQANMSESMLSEMQDLTQTRVDFMTDYLEQGEAVSGSGWWNDRSISLFETIKEESNVFLVGMRGGDDNKIKLMDMIGEALQISYADRGNYIRDYIDVDLETHTDNVTGELKANLEHFGNNLNSDENDDFSTADLQNSNWALFKHSNQQYRTLWGLRSALYRDVHNNEFRGQESKLSDEEVKFVENQFHRMMDLGDNMEAYLYNGGDLLNNSVRDGNDYRAMEEEWFTFFDSMMSVIDGDESTQKVFQALGGLNSEGEVSEEAIANVINDFQENFGSEEENSALDFNSDGIIDSADYDVLMRVVGDRRNESAFDAIMVQDSMNNDKVSLYSSLAHSDNASDNDKLIYESLEMFYEEQVEANFTITKNINDYGFDTDAEATRFQELANQLDEMNEAVERELRQSLGTNDVIEFDQDLKEASTIASNEMMFLSHGFSVEESAALSNSVSTDIKLDEELTEETAFVIQLLDNMKDEGIISQAIMVDLVSDFVESNNESIFEFSRLEEVFGDDFTRFAEFQNEEVLMTYLDIAFKDPDTEKYNLLENYAQGDYGFTDEQSQDFLKYLRESENANFAQSLVNFVSENASDEVIGALDTLFENRNTIDRDLNMEDFDFIEKLETLGEQLEISINTEPLKDAMLNNFDLDGITELSNNILDSIIAKNEELEGLGKDIDISTMRQFMSNLTKLNEEPEKAVLNHDGLIGSSSAKNAFIVMYCEDYRMVAMEMFEAHNGLLENMPESVDTGKAITANNTIVSWKDDIQELGNQQNLTNNNQPDFYLKAPFKESFTEFHENFESGAPEGIQDRFYNLLQNTNDKQAVDTFVKFAIEGNTEALDDLETIAYYDNKDINLIGGDLSAQSISVAADILDTASQLRDMGPTFDISASRLENLAVGLANDHSETYTGRESIESFVTGASNTIEDIITANNNSVSNEDLAALLETNINELTANVFARNELNSVGVVSSGIANGNQNIIDQFNLNDENVADIQVQYYDSLISLYDSLLDAERAKEEPDQGLIDNYESARGTYMSARETIS